MQKKVEQQSMVVSAIVNLIMAFSGFYVFAITNIQALFLDGAFSLIGFVSAIAATIISKVSKKTTKSYPKGLYFLEPLYAIFKSSLTLYLLVISVVSTAQSAYVYFSTGVGEPLKYGPILPYSIAMTVLCFGLSFFNRSQNKRIHNTSTIITAESKSNMVDGILSLGLGISLILFSYIAGEPGGESSLDFLNYTGDFFVTTVLVLLSLKAPIQVFIQGFKELSGAKCSDKDIMNQIVKSFKRNMGENFPDLSYQIFKTGMRIRVQITIPSCYQTKEELVKFHEQRNITVNDLRIRYNNIETIAVLN